MDGADRLGVFPLLRIGYRHDVGRRRIRHDLVGGGVDVVHRVEGVRSREALRVARREDDRCAFGNVLDVEQRIADADVVHPGLARGQDDAGVRRLPVGRLVDGEHGPGRVVGDHLDRADGTIGLEHPALALVEVDPAELLVDDLVVVVVGVGNAAGHELGGVAVLLQQGNRGMRRNAPLGHHLVLQLEGLRPGAAHDYLVLAGRRRNEHKRIVVGVDQARCVRRVVGVAVVVYAGDGKRQLVRLGAAGRADAVLASGLERGAEVVVPVEELAGKGISGGRERDRLRALLGSDDRERLDAGLEPERGGSPDVAGQHHLVPAARRVAVRLGVPVVGVEVGHLRGAAVDLVDAEARARLVVAVLVVVVVGVDVEVDVGRAAAGDPHRVRRAALEGHGVVQRAVVVELLFIGVVLVDQRRRLRAFERDRLLKAAAALGRLAERGQRHRHSGNACNHLGFHVLCSFRRITLPSGCRWRTGSPSAPLWSGPCPSRPGTRHFRCTTPRR